LQSNAERNNGLRVACPEQSVRKSRSHHRDDHGQRRYTTEILSITGGNPRLGILLRSLLFRDARELIVQSALNLLRMPFAASHAADVRTVDVELTRDSAVKPAQRLHVAIQQGHLAFDCICVFHPEVRCGVVRGTLRRGRLSCPGRSGADPANIVPEALANSAKYGTKSGIVGDNLSALGRIPILIAVGLWLASRSSFWFHDVAVKGLRIVIHKIDAAKQQPGQ
jgi:hypothetical protein